MPCPHFDVKIIQRSKRQSAVASAAYQSGERLFSEYDQKYAEIWRQGWADTANRYLEAIGSPERLDLRSYARQGIDKIPTVHMGPAVSQLEKKGIQTDQHRKPEPGHQYTHCPMDMLFLNSCLPSPLLLYGMHPIHTGSHGLYV